MRRAEVLLERLEREVDDLEARRDRAALEPGARDEGVAELGDEGRGVDALCLLPRLEQALAASLPRPAPVPVPPVPVPLTPRQP